MPPIEEPTTEPQAPNSQDQTDQANQTDQTDLNGSVEPNLLDRAGAIFTERASLLAENRNLRAQLGTARAVESQIRGELEAALASVQGLTNDLDASTRQHEALQAALTAAEAQQRTVEAAVVDELAMIGVPSATLPASASEPVKDGVELALEKFRAATDPDLKAAAFREYKLALAGADSAAG
jgi:chromosome segregation ATPase